MIGATQRAAKLLAELRMRAPGTAPIEDIPEEFRPKSLLQAYAVQTKLRALLTAGGMGPQIGWKIGCTTPVMQDYLKIPHPCAGTLYEGTFHNEHAEIPADDYYGLGLECEVAVVLGADLPLIEQGYDMEMVAEAVDYVMTSIEIVEHRFRDFTRAKVGSLVADDFFSAGIVIGAPVEAQYVGNMAELTGGFWIDGKELPETGTGAAILGHPLHALAWLADQCAALDTPLLEGQLITLGSVVKTIYPEPGQRIEAQFGGLPPARIDVV